MPEPDELLSPNDLRRDNPRWGIQFQRTHRAAGDFVPHIQIGSRIFYRRSSVEKFLAEQEAKAMAPRSGASRN
jgi:hypothetical protein